MAVSGAPPRRGRSVRTEGRLESERQPCILDTQEVLLMRSSRTRIFVRAACLAIALGLWVSPALAQGPGVRAGVSLDPDQFYFGGHIETDPLVDRLRFRPNVEIGVGDDVTIVAFNFEFAYHFPSRRPWNLYAGAGPALNLVDTEQDTDPEGGFNILLGAQHRGGLFFEFKVGTIDSPDVKFGVGYSWR
jgi:hypothetical protein